MSENIRKWTKRLASAVVIALLSVLCFTMPISAGILDDILISATPDWEELTLANVVTIAPLTHDPPITLKGFIMDDGGSVITERGFVWSLSSYEDPGDVSPEEADYEYHWTEEGEFGEGRYSYDPPDLVERTEYYGRAVVLNSSGWSYGNEVTFDPITPIPREASFGLLWIVTSVIAISIVGSVLTHTNPVMWMILATGGVIAIKIIESAITLIV